MAVAAKIGAWSDRKSKRNDRRVQTLAIQAGRGSWTAKGWICFEHDVPDFVP